MSTSPSVTKPGGRPMSPMKPPLIIGHDRATGEPIIVPPGQFAVVISPSGSIDTYCAPVAHGLVIDKMSTRDLEARAESFANKVAEKLGTASASEPERLDIDHAAAAASVTAKALRHRVQRGLVPDRLIIREGRRLFFVADAWRRFVVSNRSGTGR